VYGILKTYLSYRQCEVILVEPASGVGEVLQPVASRTIALAQPTSLLTPPPSAAPFTSSPPASVITHPPFSQPAQTSISPSTASSPASSRSVPAPTPPVSASASFLSNAERNYDFDMMDLDDLTSLPLLSDPQSSPSRSSVSPLPLNTQPNDDGFSLISFDQHAHEPSLACPAASLAARRSQPSSNLISFKISSPSSDDATPPPSLSKATSTSYACKPSSAYAITSPTIDYFDSIASPPSSFNPVLDN
jgi:hypothetical protein